MESNNSGQVLWAALIRGLVIAFASGLVSGAAALSAGVDDRAALIAAIGAFAAALIVRYGGEGGYDANRAKMGNVQASDVGRSVTTTVVNAPVIPPNNS